MLYDRHGSGSKGTYRLGLQSHFAEQYAARKTFAAPLVWAVEDRDLRLSCPLAIGDVMVEGLEFVGRATNQPDKACHFMLRATDTRGTYHLLERIDWRPVHSHNNKGQGPAELRYTIQRTAHAHSFEMNWVKAEERMLSGGVPLAAPIDIDGLEVEDAFKFAAKRFNIATGKVIFPPPPWEPDLFNG